MSILKKLLFLLSPPERKKAYLLLMMITISSLLDMMGVASITPFIAVLSNPNLIETNFVINNIFKILSKFGVKTDEEFLLALGMLVFLLLIISQFFKAFTAYVQTRFIYMSEYNISKRLVESYLSQPYSWFLSHNSADLGKNILSEVAIVISGGMSQLLDLIAKSILTIVFITLLILVDPKLTIIIGFSLGCCYLLIFFLVKKYLSRIGEDRIKNNHLRFMTVSEMFGAAKEVKTLGLEETYIKNFSKSAKIVAITQSLSTVVSQLPRFILETIAFGGILLIILYKTSQDTSFNNSLPIISLYVFAGYRLLPALQQIYGAFSRLVFAIPSINKLYCDFINIKPHHKINNKGSFIFNKEINFKNVCYNYPSTSQKALKDINLTIPAKSICGFVGSTGCGKTTTVDIILGLLEPQRGTLDVDGQVITKQNSMAWRRLIGYVSQNIYLKDDTIMANIAFGVEPKDINQEIVETASKNANLHNFVINELPNKYHTIVGERGVRLSGGQRKRIGIARALYHNPKVLILDEATSALDNKTEKTVMDAVTNLDKNITVILIAHRLSTVIKCDKIFFLENGELKAEGTYDKLIKTNKNFSDMAMRSK